MYKVYESELPGGDWRPYGFQLGVFPWLVLLVSSACLFHRRSLVISGSPMVASRVKPEDRSCIYRWPSSLPHDSPHSSPVLVWLGVLGMLLATNILFSLQLFACFAPFPFQLPPRAPPFFFSFCWIRASIHTNPFAFTLTTCFWSLSRTCLEWHLPTYAEESVAAAII